MDFRCPCCSTSIIKGKCKCVLPPLPARFVSSYEWDYHRGYREQAIKGYGGKCNHCGERDPDVLCLDHVENDGAEHRREVGSGSSMYLWAIKNNFPNRLQLLCYNCNASKEFSGKGIPLPHRKDLMTHLYLMLGEVPGFGPV